MHDVVVTPADLATSQPCAASLIILYLPHSLSIPFLHTTTLLDMSDSTATILASGSQDLAALIGLFATEGVERNALAFHLGWGSVVASSLSLLGVLGLIKSSIKLALGLEHCAVAGFNLDSIRGIFGYLPEESPALGKSIPCDYVTVQLSYQELKITKSTRWFSAATTPIVTLGMRSSANFHTTTIGLDNLKAENAFTQSRLLIALNLTLCSGLTTWLLEIVQAEWSWVKIVAIPGLHTCLILLLALPIWYDWQINRPGHCLTVDKWDILNGKVAGQQTTLHLLKFGAIGAIYSISKAIQPSSIASL